MQSDGGSGGGGGGVGRGATANSPPFHSGLFLVLRALKEGDQDTFRRRSTALQVSTAGVLHGALTSSASGSLQVRTVCPQLFALN